MKPTIRGFSALAVVLIATAAFAQNPSSSANVTPTLTAASAPVNTFDAAALFTKPTKSVPMPQGAGSDDDTYVSFKLYVYKVHRGDDPAYIESNILGNVTGIPKFNYGVELAPKIEFGHNGGTGWGFRASYFYTKQNADRNVTATAAPPFIVSPRPLNVIFTGAADANTPASFEESLRIQYFDGEVSHKWKTSNSSTVVSAGIRVAPTRQVYTARDTFGGTAENLTYTQKRTGKGPTVGVDLRRRLGSSNFWFTGHGRFSYLFGSIAETATFTSGAFTQGANRNNSRNTPVLEGEAGLEYAKKYSGGTKEFFLNASFSAQDWFKLVNVMPTSPVGSSATALLDNPAAPATKKGDVLMIGGSFAVGFRF